MPITDIIQVADLHIPNEFKHHGRPYRDMLKTAAAVIYKYIKSNCQSLDSTRIVIVGDIFHNKVKVSNEAVTMWHEFLNYLDAICRTIVLAGNHDMLENNADKQDSLTPTFCIKGVCPNVIYIDKALGYQSGIYLDENVAWVAYSMFSKFSTPDLRNVRSAKEGVERVIGLYHGVIGGAVTDTGHLFPEGIDTNGFAGCDAVLCGHVHKYQTIRKGGIPLVYCGSAFQHDAGENISGHGFVHWTLSDMSYRQVEIPNPYRILKFEIDSYEDVEEDIERLINL